MYHTASEDESHTHIDRETVMETREAEQEVSLTEEFEL